MESNGCVGCKHEFESADSVGCLGCEKNAIDKYKRRTNADKIRSMNDEDLAEFLISFNNTFGEEYEGQMSCMEWLERQVKE